MSNQTSNIRTPNIGGPLRNPRFVVVHFTAGTSMQGAVSWLCDKRARASAHVVIGRDGELQALVPFDRVAWHAGASSWKTYNGLNNYAIGIELVNAGPLRQTEEGLRPITSNELIPAEDVFEGKHKNGSSAYTHWQKFPDAQVEALDKLLGQLFNDFPSLVEVVGHDDICVPSGRKVDPGPAFADRMTELKRKYDRWQGA